MKFASPLRGTDRTIMLNASLKRQWGRLENEVRISYYARGWYTLMCLSKGYHIRRHISQIIRWNLLDVHRKNSIRTFPGIDSHWSPLLIYNCNNIVQLSRTLIYSFPSDSHSEIAFSKCAGYIPFGLCLGYGALVKWHEHKSLYFLKSSRNDCFLLAPTESQSNQALELNFWLSIWIGPCWWFFEVQTLSECPQQVMPEVSLKHEDRTFIQFLIPVHCLASPDKSILSKRMIYFSFFASKNVRIYSCTAYQPYVQLARIDHASNVPITGLAWGMCKELSTLHRLILAVGDLAGSVRTYQVRDDGQSVLNEELERPGDPILDIRIRVSFY